MSEILFLAMGCGGDVGKVDLPPVPVEAAEEDPAEDGPDRPGPTNEPAQVDPYGDADPWPTNVDVRVCADGSEAYVDIQEAIDAAEFANVIGVCPGTYGPIFLGLREDLDIVGIGGPSVTTIDGGDDTAVHVRDATLRLSGFTLTGTGVSFEWETDHGGALTVREGDVTVRDTVISGVTGPYSLVFDENLLLMEDVVWEANTNTMLWNLFQGTSATFRRNIVRGGTFQHVAVTERIDVLDITQTVFTGITIDTGYSAFMLPTDGTGPFRMANNVFFDIDDLDPFGGRLFDFPDVDFRNNIVMGSESWDLQRFASSWSMFYENGVDYLPRLTGRGNLDADPMFADPLNGDFSLLPGSPAIDAGDPDPAYADPDGTRNDLGIQGGP